MCYVVLPCKVPCCCYLALFFVTDATRPIARLSVGEVVTVPATALEVELGTVVGDLLVVPAKHGRDHTANPNVQVHFTPWNTCIYAA